MTGTAASQIPMSTAAADAAVAVEMLAWQSAARGLHDDASRALGQVRVLTDRAGTTSVMTESYWWLADPQERSWPSGAAVAGDPQGAARCAVTITLST